MLNELKTLADAISAAGFSGDDWDDKFKEIKATVPCFVVELSDDGDIADIRFLAPEKAKALRTWQGGSLGEYFPGFNFLPFYKLEETKGKTLSPTEKKKALDSLVAAFVNAEEPPSEPYSIADRARIVLADRVKADKKTSKCLGAVAGSFFKLTESVPSSQRLGEAVARMIGGGNAAETFNAKLLGYLRNHVSADMTNQKDNSTLFSILFQKTADVVLFFDIHEPKDFPLASEAGMRSINECLAKAKDKAAAETPVGGFVDAFGRSAAKDELGEKLPEVKLPSAIANTKLRSMNAESKCQTRYGRIDAESFPVGREIRKAAKAALSWIASPEREGQTWAIAGANELVFAYPKRMPSVPPKLARLLGNGRRISAGVADGEAEARFERYAKDALQGLKTLAQGSAPNTEIEVFAIKKADKARRKVVFYRNYSLERLESAVNDWNDGARNLPPIFFLRWPVPPKGEKLPKGTKPVVMEFHAPLPLSAVDLAYANWSQDGNENFDPKFRVAPLYESLPIFDGLELFLGDSERTGLARRMLSQLLQDSLSLVVASGNMAHKRMVIENRRAASYLETALPLLGILLHKLNHNKENYMENAPYLIGRFLNLADGLHAVWCRNVKKEDPLPPQLLGSSLFASFQLNPVQAFANAALRMKPYLDWAKTSKTDDVKLARWYVGEFGRVSAAIMEAGIPTRLSDADKAEMLLGYLASSGKQTEAEPSAN